MKYSILLSTIGKRATLERCVSNFQSFLARKDIELVVATTDPNLALKGPGRVIHVQKPIISYLILTLAKTGRFSLKETLGRMYFMWRQAADNADGDWMVFVSDDTMLSKNIFNRADKMMNKATKVFQPSLLDPQGYVVCGEYFRSYTISVVRRKLVYEFNLTSDLHALTAWLDEIRNSCNKNNPDEYIFDTESFCLHLGYPIDGGVPPVIAQWDVGSWIAAQRIKFGNRRIDIDENFGTYDGT